MTDPASEAVNTSLPVITIPVNEMLVDIQVDPVEPAAEGLRDKSEVSTGAELIPVENDAAKHDPIPEDAIHTFEINGKPVRGVVVDGKSAMFGTDFATAMGYADPKDAIRRHCKGAVKRHLPTKGGKQDVVLIFAPDIFRLTTKSKLPDAVKFEKKVYEEILPAIHEKGYYAKPGVQLAVQQQPAHDLMPVVHELLASNKAMMANNQNMMTALMTVIQRQDGFRKSVMDLCVVVSEDRKADAQLKQELDQTSGKVEQIANTQSEHIAYADKRFDAISKEVAELKQQQSAVKFIPAQPTPVHAQVQSSYENDEYISVETYLERMALLRLFSAEKYMELEMRVRHMCVTGGVTIKFEGIPGKPGAMRELFPSMLIENSRNAINDEAIKRNGNGAHH